MRECFNYTSKVLYLEAIVLLALLVLRPFSYLPFHSVLELISAGIAILFFWVLFTKKVPASDSFYGIVGVAFLCVALIDILHLLSYKGMNILPVDEANVATQFWIAGRFILAFGLLVGTLLSRHRIRSRYIFGSLFCVSLLFVMLIFLELFPDAYVAGEGLTPFKVFSEYAIMAILVLSIIALGKMRRAFDFKEQLWLILAITLMVLSEFMFTLYQDVYGVFNALGHLFKLFSCYALLNLVLSTDPAEASLKEQQK